MANLSKFFVRVPNGVEFAGATVSAANPKKIYFDENKQVIWAKGVSFGMDSDMSAKLTTLIGEDANMSVRAIAQDVVNNIASWQGADADTIINTLKEVLDWFNDLPEGDAGAVALVGSVGKAATYYAEGDTLPEGKAVGDVKTEATGLYKLIADQKATIDAKIGDVGEGTVKAYVDAQDTATLNSAKAYTDEKIGTLGNKVEAAEAVYYTQEEIDNAVEGDDAYGKSTSDVKTPAVEAVPYTNVMDVITDNEHSTATALTDLDARIDALDSGTLNAVEVAGVNATIADNKATVTKADLQNALFARHTTAGSVSNTAAEASGNIVVTVTEQDGENTAVAVDASALTTRVSNLETFQDDPWEEYSAS